MTLSMTHDVMTEHGMTTNPILTTKLSTEGGI